jgi:hypothetical protein
MSFKIKLEKSKIIRLQNYIDSDYYNENDLDLTTHWDKRLRVEKYMRNANDMDRKLHPIRFAEYPWSKNDEVLLYKLDDFNHIFISQPVFKKAVKLSKSI